MARSSVLSANAPAGSAKNATGTEFVDADQDAEDRQRRNATATGDLINDVMLPQQRADAVREVPRTRTESANPRLNRQFPDPSAPRKMLSSRMKKDYSHKKREWEQSTAKVRIKEVNSVVADHEHLEVLNNALRENLGARSQISGGARRRIEALDRAIQDFEAKNDRQHIVYATMLAPADTKESRAEVRDALRTMAQDDSDSAYLAFDGYIPANHSLGNLAHSQDIVMEIQTRSGAYLGTSDSTPDADHIVGRGRRLKPVGVRRVEYVTPDGKTRKRDVVQMVDITDDE